MKIFYYLLLLFLAIACSNSESLTLLEDQNNEQEVRLSRTPICDVEEEVILNFEEVAGIINDPYFEFEFFVLAYRKLADTNNDYLYLIKYSGLWHCNRTSVYQPTPDTYAMKLWFESYHINLYKNKK